MEIWKKIQEESLAITSTNSISQHFYQENILNFPSLEKSVANYIFQIIQGYFGPTQLELKKKIFFFFQQPDIIEIIKKDLYAAYKRDPACNQISHILLYYKGFHSLCIYRFSHYLLLTEKDSASAHLLQYIASIKFSVDINPRAKIGKGIFIDHSHSIVIGETCVIQNYVSILQNVTLGGTGKEKGKDRHPKIGEGVLIGAGAKILGNIKIGDHCIIGASSVVLQDIPNGSVVVGIPAKVIKKNITKYPADELDHHLIC